MDKELTGKAGKPGSKKEKKDHQPKDPSSNEPHKEKERPRDKSKQKKAGAEGKHIKKSTGQSVRGSELGTGDGKPSKHLISHTNKPTLGKLKIAKSQIF